MATFIQSNDIENIEEEFKLSKTGANNWVNKVFGVFTMITLSAMVVLVFVNAVLRYVFNRSLPESEEFARFFFVWTIFLGIIVGYRDGSHVSVTILTDLLKGIPKKLVQACAHLITLLALIFILIGGIEYTSHASRFVTAATGTNFALISVAIVVMAIGMLTISVRQAYNFFINLKSGNKHE